MLAKSQKAMVWAGVFLSAIYGLGYVLMGFFPPPSPTLGATEVLKLYATNHTQFRIGVMLMMIGGGFNVLWSTVTAVQMARQEEGTPIWSILQLCGGVLNTLLFFLPAVFWGVAALLFKTGPFAWDGLFPFYLPVFVFSAWAVTLVCLLLRDAGRQSALSKTR